MRIAVTGNLGYIGPVVVGHLAGLPAAELIGFDCGFFAGRLTGPCHEARDLAAQFFRDVRDIERRHLAGVDAVVHLAAISNDPMSRRFEHATRDINHRATARLARIAREAGVRRFVLASSCSVYGAAGTGWVNERTTPAPLTPYAESKRDSERSLAELAAEDFQITCLRFATAYGWSPRLRLDLALNDFAATAWATRQVQLMSDGSAWRPFIHVRDMARAIEWALGRGGRSFVAINAGATGANWRVSELAARVASILGAEVRKPADAAADRRSYRVDFRWFELLAAGFTPREQLCHAVEEMAEGLSALGYRAADKPRYSRLNTLQELLEANRVDDSLRQTARHKVPAAVRCRLCGQPLDLPMADLGESPLANSYRPADASGGEERFRLDVWTCTHCWLVQLGTIVPPEKIFSEYAYLSSCSSSWVERAKSFTVDAVSRLDLGTGSRVVEIASNDGYLLQHFVAAGIPCLGVEPASNIAAISRERGIDTRNIFFSADTALELASEGCADLIVANNVLAHVPDLHSFVLGIRLLLKPDGAASVEIPHLLELLRENQFDTVYHEHYSYFSLLVLDRLFAMHDLRIFDVERLETHGGSLRVWACRAESARFQASEAVGRLLVEEWEAGLNSPAVYREFGGQVDSCRNSLLNLLARLEGEGKKVAAYGAAAKGNTLLNYCGIDAQRIAYVADRNPLKQGKRLPGSGIPVVDPAEIERTRPDYLLILPWNLTEEIRAEMSSIRSWGGKFIRPIPAAEELP